MSARPPAGWRAGPAGEDAVAGARGSACAGTGKRLRSGSVGRDEISAVSTVRSPERCDLSMSGTGRPPDVQHRGLGRQGRADRDLLHDLVHADPDRLHAFHDTAAATCPARAGNRGMRVVAAAGNCVAGGRGAVAVIRYRVRVTRGRRRGAGAAGSRARAPGPLDWDSQVSRGRPARRSPLPPRVRQIAAIQPERRAGKSGGSSSRPPRPEPGK